MMPSMVHAPIMNNVGYMLKEKSGDAVVSAFTAVNGRTSPPSPRRLTDTNVNTNANTTANPITVETNHVRSLSRPTPIQTQAQNAPLPGRDEWASGPRVSENGHRNGHQNGHHSVSSSLSDQDTAQHSPGKRKRSISTDDVHSYHSPDGTVRRRLDSYAPRDDSPPNSAMERSQQRPLPPMDRVDRVDRADHDRNWQRRESQDMPHANYSNSHRRDSQDMETSPDSVNPRPSSQMGNLDGVETTRAGVQVDPKKRKRQFANRTKTGCGTCRRRKKKCDEGKPECINCTRGGFICEGYANKVPWPKNGTTKSHPPLQAKDRFPAESQGQLYHNHGSSREYPDPNPQGPGEGGRGRPIVIEEHQQQARNGWGSGWGEPPRASYPSDHQSHASTEYAHPPGPGLHARPPPNDHHAQHPTQGAPAQRQHNHRTYHHTPQTMGRQVVNSSPVTTAEAALLHQSQSQSQPPQSQPQSQSQSQSQSQALPHQQSHQPPPQQQPQQPSQQPPQQPRHQPHHQHSMLQSPPAPKPPGPPPAHYAPPPPRPQRTEKEKMLHGDPFLPYHPQLVEERERCKGAVFRFNNTSNAAVEIAPDERMRHFRSILAARWIHQYRGPNPPMAGHLGSEVFVDTPFMCDYGYNISIGDRVAIGTQCKFLDSGRITIGRNTEVGANVTIDTRKVPNDFKSMKGSRGAAIAADVHIGENVYIGANVTILAGVKIGTGAIIHPGSVVVRDIPRDVVARGNPAEVRMVHWGED